MPFIPKSHLVECVLKDSVETNSADISSVWKSKWLGLFAGRLLRIRQLHHNEQGAISVLSVITLVSLTMLLGLILNVGQQIDDKIKLQNAADAATYSTGVVMARGMNTIAFTNHLMSETFALTAYFREGRDRYAESLVPEILDAWETVGQQLNSAEFDLFRNLQPAISPKIALEREVVRAFGEMTAVKSRILLPALEAILGSPEPPPGTELSQEQLEMMRDSHLIPVFQRAVVLAIPQATVAVSKEVTARNLGELVIDKRPGPQVVVWTSRVLPWIVRQQTNPYERILPVLDPSNEGPDYSQIRQNEIGRYQAQATSRRRNLAFTYLNHWNSDQGFDLGPFLRDGYSQGGRVSAKMSQFIHLWRGFTCAKLRQLLELEYPTTNLPHMLRMPPPGANQQQYLEDDFTFVVSIYRNQRKTTMPGMYRTPISGDAVSFARVQIYVPLPRYRTDPRCLTWRCPSYNWFGELQSCGTPCYDNWPTEWTAFNQNWAAKLIPASTSPTGSSVSLLQTNPAPFANEVVLPNLSEMDVNDFRALNTH